MPSFTLTSWNAVSGANGYNVHSGQVDGLWTDMNDVGATTGPVTITVPWTGAGYACVAAYDANHYEGLYGASVGITAGALSPPVNAPVLVAR
jgi:hypothetical protein